MPTHANITLSLHSQYDAAPIREHNVRINRPPSPITTRVGAESEGGVAAGAVVHATITALPASQFWIHYTCNPYPPAPSVDSLEGHEHQCDDNTHIDSPPAPSESEIEVSEVKFLFFKLLLRDSCVLSWGVGAQEKWRGRTVCGFVDGGTDFEGRRVVEKVGLFFGRDLEDCDGEGEEFEVQVFRARGRRGVGVRYETLGNERGGGGVSLTTIGRRHRGERQRMYEYALIDAKDEPFVTFRYHFVSPGTIRSGTESGGSSLELESWEEHLRNSPRTPSPVHTTRPARSSITTVSSGESPPFQRKTASGGSVRGMVHNALKRKEGGWTLRKDGSRVFE